VCAVGFAPSAPAGGNAAQLLAQRYSPVLRLPDTDNGCVGGAVYEPTAVDRVLGSPEVALRGSWDVTSLVKVAPTAADLSRGLPGYHLDFPGKALTPGCAYDDWSYRINHGRPAQTYARVVTDPLYPGELALQYWFFYVFNDFNDKHEGDWEMIQLDFPVGSARRALSTTPSLIGYSQHEAAESATWHAKKLQLVDGTHPVVYVAVGSHANYYSSALFLGRSAAQGVGCDETSGPVRLVHPAVVVVPTARAAYLRAFPWLGFVGHWGERHRGFYDGPTGPNTKRQWNAPIAWARASWRTKSYTVPAGTALGHTATGFFCGAVALGSGALTAAVINPSPLLIVLAAIVALLAWLASRTTWTPSAPLRLARRRAWGSIVNASRRMYLGHPRVFLGIGLIFFPLGIVISLLQYLVFHTSGLDGLVAVAGEKNGAVDSLAVALGIVITLFGLAVVQSATAFAMAELDAGREVTALGAYRMALPRLGALLLVVIVPAVLIGVLDLTAIGIVLGAWLTVRWSLAAQIVSLEDDSAYTAMHESARLVRGNWWRAASLLVFITVVALLLGPLAGTALLFATSASFDFINLVSSLVYAVVLPFVAIATTYLYFDLRVRRAAELEARGADDLLPAEAM
jgi:hypothetical protein